MKFKFVFMMTLFSMLLVVNAHAVSCKITGDRMFDLPAGIEGEIKLEGSEFSPTYKLNYRKIGSNDEYSVVEGSLKLSFQVLRPHNLPEDFQRVIKSATQTRTDVTNSDIMAYKDGEDLATSKFIIFLIPFNDTAGMMILRFGEVAASCISEDL